MKVTIGQAKDTIRSIIKMQQETKKYTALILKSKPGIGKSAIIQQLADEFGIGMIDLRLAQKDPTDINGIPFVKDREKGVLSNSTPDWWPTDENSKGILFLDEITNAPTHVAHCAYELVLDRSIGGGRKLPSGWVIIAAGNTKKHMSGVKDMPAALANRFIHLDLEEDEETFTMFATNAGFDPKVVGFISFSPSSLHTMSQDNKEVYASPRSWEMVSDTCKYMGTTSKISQALIAGSVGEGIAAEFLAFSESYGKLPDLDKIAKGEEDYVKEDISDDLSVMYALASSFYSKFLKYSNDKKAMGRLDKMARDVLRTDLLRLIVLPMKDILVNQSAYTKEEYETNSEIIKSLKNMTKSLSKYISK